MENKRNIPLHALLWAYAHGGDRHSDDAFSFTSADGPGNQPDSAGSPPAGVLWAAAPSGPTPVAEIPPAMLAPIGRAATSQVHTPAATPPQHVAELQPYSIQAAASTPAEAATATLSAAAPHIASRDTTSTQTETQFAAGPTEPSAQASYTAQEVPGPATQTAMDTATGGNASQTEQIDFTSAPVPAITGAQSYTYALPSSLYEQGTFTTTNSFGGASISASVNVFAGIKGSVSLGLGDVTPDYPVSIDPGALNSVIDNTVFTIDPSLISTNDASFSLDLPTAQANLDIGLQADASLTINFPNVQIGVSVPFYGYVGTTIGLPSLPISLSVNAAFNPAQNATFGFGYGASLTVSQINASSVNSGTASANGSLPTLSASGSTAPFLTGSVDLVQLLGDLVPESGLAAVDGSVNYSVGSASWSLFSLPLSVSLGLGETVTATPMGIMETVTDELNGETQTGTLGSSFTFNAPASGSGVIPIDITYALALQIHTSLGLDGTISLALDGPSVSATVLGVGGLSEGPFGQVNLFSESGQFAQLASSTSTDTLMGSSVVDVNYQATAVSQTITTPSGGLLLNNEGEQLTNAAGVTIAGSTYGIEAAVQCVPNITNAGTVSSEAYHTGTPGNPTPSSYGIDLLGGGMVTNLVGGVITSSNYGNPHGHGYNTTDASIRLAANQANDVYNAGLITGFETGVTINGGVLINSETGTITTHSAYVSYGIKEFSDGVQITNSGLIISSDGIKLNSGGEVNNTASGIIHAYGYGVAATGSLSLTNSGTIISQFTGVDANNATVINMSGGLIEGESSVGVRLGGNTATLVNGGTISGNGAVYLDASASNTLVIAEGAVFDGVVAAGNASAANGIYLAPGTTGTLAGVGSEFTGFQSITIGQGATWQIAGTPANLGTTTIDGFKPGDTLDFTGLAFTGRGPGYIAGESVQVDALTGVVSIIEAQSLTSSGITLATAQFGSVLADEGFNVVSDGHGGTLLEQTGPMNATISTQGLGGIVLATGSVYASILTITATGSAADQGVVSGQTVNINDGIQALEGASITNAGSVSGYQDGIYLTQGGTISNLAGGTLQGVNGSGIDIAGGVGIVLNSGLIEGTTGATMAAGGTLTNDARGTITGRLFGIELGPQTSGLPILVNEGLVKCTSATSVELTGGGFVYNEPTGVITGGAITGTDFGVLAVNDFAKVTNCGTISGGTGIDLTAGGFVVNESGTIKGGVVVSGGIGYLSSCGSISGVNGVAFSNGGTIVNSAAGTIIGTSGYGVSLGSASASASDDVKNSGLIECATYGAILSGATTTLFDAGTIAAINGGDAVQLDGSTTNKLQLAAGFVFVGDVVAKSGAANSIELTASATAGVLSGLGTSLQGFSAVTLDSGAAWTIETTAAEAGKISFSGQSANDTLALTGGGTLGTNLSGFGTLLLDAPGTFTINSNATLSDQVIAIAAGAVLSGHGTLAGALADAGVVTASGGTLVIAGAPSGTGTLQAASGAMLDLKAGGALTEAMNGAGTLRLDGATPFTLAGNTVGIGTLAVGSGATLSGYGTIAGAIGASGTVVANGGKLVLDGAVGQLNPLQAKAGSVLDLKAASVLMAPITGAGTLQLDSALFKYYGSAPLSIASVLVDAGASLLSYGTISSAITDNGTVEAFDGKLILSGQITGTGSLQAAAGETLDLTAGGTLTEAVSGAGTLELGGATAHTLAGAPLSIAAVAVDAGATLAGHGTISTTVADSGTIAASGGTLVLTGSLSGTGTLQAASGAMLDLKAGGALTEAINGAGTLRLDGATPFTLAGNTVGIGTLAVGGGATLSGFGTIASAIEASGTVVASGGKLVLDGAVGQLNPLQAKAGSVLDLKAASVLMAPITGAGTLQLDSALFKYYGSAPLSIASVLVDAGASLLSYGTISSAITDNGTLEAFDGKLILSGQITGTGSLQAAAGETLDLTAGGTLTEAVSGAGTLELGGVTTLGKVAPTIAHMQIDATGALSGAGTLTGALVNIGSIASSGGTLAFLGSVTNTGTADAASGLLSFKDAVTGTGTLAVGATGTLALGDGAAAGQLVDFLAASGALDLTHPSSFLGSVAGFAGTASIDLVDTLATGFGYTPGTNGGLLKITDNGGSVASIQFEGSYASSSFSLASDGHGGTLIRFV